LLPAPSWRVSPPMRTLAPTSTRKIWLWVLPLTVIWEPPSRSVVPLPAVNSRGPWVRVMVPDRPWANTTVSPPPSALAWALAARRLAGLLSSLRLLTVRILGVTRSSRHSTWRAGRLPHLRARTGPGRQRRPDWDRWGRNLASQRGRDIIDSSVAHSPGD